MPVPKSWVSVGGLKTEFPKRDTRLQATNGMTVLSAFDMTATMIQVVKNVTAYT